MKVIGAMINKISRAYIKVTAHTSSKNYCRFLRMCGFEIGGG